ncbi:MAG: NAD(P)H-dependent oxidoreductase [Clostridia bacterium]|nr:NAD(P)H-dependent oxidoreductase [Clostridia bacterium]
MKSTVLYVNACVRKDSRTERLASAVLKKLDSPVVEVRLEGLAFPVSDKAFLNERDRLISAGDFGSPLFDLARQFAEAESVVIAAPYWDLSFPATLKQYFEQINVVGITFRYTEDGRPAGLCKARKLYYVTTAGGRYVPEEFGFGYVRALAQNFYGIPEVKLFKAEGLDIGDIDAEIIVKNAEKTVSETVFD